MKRLLTLLFFAFLAITTQAQTNPNLPAGSKPFGTQYWVDPDGNVWAGNGFDVFTNLGNWQRVVDSLAIKMDYADTLALIATKQDLANLPPSGVLSVTGDGVDNTDPANPVLSYPTPGEIGALAPGDNVSALTNDAGYLTTESDPVYSGDPAAGITSGNISAWDAKQNAITGGASTIDTENLTVNRALISNGSGKVAVSPVSNTELAFLDGVTSNVQTQLNAKVPNSDVGASNGVAPLGADGKVPGEYLPSSGSYKGTWDASTNTPTIADGVGTNGDRYRVSVGGTQDLGSGNITFVAGDDVIYNGTVWQRSPSGVTVTSVAGKTGDVVLDKNDVGLGNVDNTSDLNKPISNATQAALDLKLNTADLPAPQTLSLTTNGDLTISGGNSVYLYGLGDNALSESGDMNNISATMFGAIGTSTGNQPPDLQQDRGGFINITRSGSPSGFQIAVDLNGGLFARGNNPSGAGWSDWQTFASEEWTNAQGFLKSADLTNYVTTNTTQTLTGRKTFSSVPSYPLALQAGSSTDVIYLPFFANDGTTRLGYLGFSSGTNNNLVLTSDAASSGIGILDSGGANAFYFSYGSGAKTVWHAGNLDPATAGETVITTSVNFIIDWQNDIAPNSGGKTYAEVHGDHFTYSAFYEDGSGALVNYSPAVKIVKSGSSIASVQFADILNGEIVIK